MRCIWWLPQLQNMAQNSRLPQLRQGDTNCHVPSNQIDASHSQRRCLRRRWMFHSWSSLRFLPRLKRSGELRRQSLCPKQTQVAPEDKGHLSILILPSGICSCRWHVAPRTPTPKLQTEVTWQGSLLKQLELNQREIFEDTGKDFGWLEVLIFAFECGKLWQCVLSPK